MAEVKVEVHAAPEALKANWDILSEDERKSAQLLLNAAQSHVFEKWPLPGQKDAEKKALLAQVKLLNEQYPGGILGYVKSARKLLEESKQGVNPFDGYTPSVPAGQRLTAGTNDWTKAEEVGLKEVGSTAFVLVAGGLGERLGYEGIKISLPIETVTEKSFIQFYVEYILAFQTRARREKGKENLLLQLAIMTSGDTHEATVKLLKDNKNFGMEEGQITIVKQEKVPSLIDNDARFAVEDNNPFEISTKPHGHGDVHTLLHMSGLAKKWVNSGVEWILFFQDTNAIVFRAVPAALGVSKQNDFDVNSLTVPRKPGEAVGGICKLTHKNGSTLTINVEYNQLDPLLRATISPDGDVPDATGYSPFPGNMNVLVFKAKSYADVLEKTGGAVPEFVNPKYKDATKTTFKKPTRLECMMQDYPKLVDSSAKVGFTQIERWLSFSPVKNSLEEAAAKVKSTGFGECASSGEADIFALNRRLLELGKGVKIDASEEKGNFGGIPVELGAKVVLAPSFGVTFAEIAKKLENTSIHLSGSSTLVIDGENVDIKDLDLDGTLVLTAKDDGNLVVDKAKIHNAGWSFKEIDVKDKSIDQKYRIRGYVVERKGDATFSADGGKTVTVS